MSTTAFKGTPVHTFGTFVQTGSFAPSFQLVKDDLSEYNLQDTSGKNVVLNIFPSLDTSVCATSVRKFNKLAAALPNTVVLAVSRDLPFAMGRFCTTEGIDHVIPLSDFRAAEFGKAYGVLMEDGPLKGLLARAVVVISPEGKMIHTQLVPEITSEPDYDAVLQTLK